MMKRIGKLIGFCAGCTVVVVVGEACLGACEGVYDFVRGFVKRKKDDPETKSRRWFFRDREVEDSDDGDTVIKGFANR